MTRRDGFIECIYEVSSGQVFYVQVESGEDDRIVTEAEALAFYGSDAYSGAPLADRMLGQARRIQVPAILSTDRRRFTVVPADEAPILIDGEAHVPERAA